MTAPVNPALLPGDATRYLVDLTDLVPTSRLQHPAVFSAVMSDAAGFVARRYRDQGYTEALTGAIRGRAQVPEIVGSPAVLFPAFGPRPGEDVLLIDPNWDSQVIPSTSWSPYPEAFWELSGAHRPDGREITRADPPAWLDLVTGQWVMFTTHPFEDAQLIGRRPYISPAREHPVPAPWDPDAGPRYERLHVKAPATRYLPAYLPPAH